MLFFALAWLAGDLLLQQMPVLPAAWFYVVALSGVVSVTAILPWLAPSKWRCILLFLVIATISFTYTAKLATNRLAWSIPPRLQQQIVLVRGTIVNLPSHHFHQMTVLFHLKEWTFASKTNTVDANVLLAFPETQTVQVGDEWQGLVRWKPIHGLASPGAGDYAAWCLQENIRASATVVPSVFNHVVQHHHLVQWINQKREHIANAFAVLNASMNLSPWLLALMIGEREGIPEHDWEVLRLTGTNHLMAIAGLHIGMLSIFLYGLVNRLWRYLPGACLLYPAQQMGLIAAALGAVVYAALAGFSLPTERAVIMLLIALSARFFKQHLPTWHGFSLALFLVLFFNPFVVLTESFWLSFTTIAAVILGMHARLAPEGIWWRWGRVQWVIAIALVPLNLVLFQSLSLISVLANCIAIPWLCFTILPLCLLSLLTLFPFPVVAKGLLWCANVSLSKLWWVLSSLSALSWSNLTLGVSDPLVIIASSIAIFFILLPRGTPGRWLACFGFLPLYLTPIAPLPKQTVRLSVLDVGQGLAMVLQTAHHALVYDAGPHLGMDAGERVVLPFLLKSHISRLDKLIISHGDNDHIGGAATLLKQMPIATVQTSVPERFSVAKPCLANQAWDWDGVHFEFLYPRLEDLRRKNDSSCVLQISVAKHAVLLTGDIEQYAQGILLSENSPRLRSEVLVAPHHGSKTSGRADFIAAVHPKLVIYATGFLNRYHFPHASVLTTYAAINAQQWNTATCGTFSFSLNLNGITNKQCYRLSHPHYWW